MADDTTDKAGGNEVTSGPPWSSPDECLRARHQAAYDEARASESWPLLDRLRLRGPDDLSEDNLHQARGAVAECGAALVKLLEQFAQKLAALDQLEAQHLESLRQRASKSGHQLPPSEVDRSGRDRRWVGEAVAMVKLQAGFARWAVTGTSTPREGRGRPPSLARTRAAQRLANASAEPTLDGDGGYVLEGSADELSEEIARLTGNVPGKTAVIVPSFEARLQEQRRWSPTARDLALLSICEGSDVLPSKWRTMSVPELIADEERAMRPYLGTGKK